MGWDHHQLTKRVVRRGPKGVVHLTPRRLGILLGVKSYGAMTLAKLKQHDHALAVCIAGLNQSALDLVDYELLVVTRLESRGAKVYDITDLGRKVLDRQNDNISQLMLRIKNLGRNKYLKAPRNEYVSIIWEEFR